MKMVRRRVRTPAVPKTVAAEAEVVVSGSGIAAFTNEQLLEDQYFASPKRKDCKIEDNCNEVGANATVGYEQDELEELEQYNEDSNASSTSSTSAASSSSSSSTTRSKSSSPTKIKSEKGYGRTIGVPLATRSQTRTIENFFKANAAKTNRNSPNSIIIDDGQNEILLSNKLIQQPTLSASLATPAQINAHHGSSSSSYIQQQGATQQSLVTRHCLNNVIVPKEFIFDLSEDTTNDSEQTELSEDIVPAAAAAAIPLPIQTANDILNDCDDADGDDEFEEQLLQQEQYEQQILLNGFANGFDFSLHRSSQRSDSHSSSHSSSNTSATTATDNIFLQEPVLHLNVDKSPNQASSIKINKTLEVEPKFSSPTSLTASVLHGRFNQIVSLNVSPSKRDSLGYEKNSHALAINELNGHDYALMMPDTDSSSCDSGVAFTSNTNTTNASSSSSSASSSSMENAMHAVSPAVTAHLTRRRKPATPHRILCPSPIKAAVAGSPSPRKMSSSLSPRKSQRHLTPTAQAAASAGGIGVSNLCKSRRRLNASPPQKQHDLPLHNKLAHEQQQPQQQQIKQEHNVAIADDDAAIVVLDDDDDDDLNDEDQQCENMLAAATANPNIALNLNAPPKSILNSCKHPSNQQNTTRLAAPTGTKAKTQPKSKYTVHRAHQQSFKHQQQPLPLAATNGNREINDFFPIRRSVRKTKTAVKEEMMRNLEQAIFEERCEGLKVRNFDGKGRGVVAERRFERGEFVIEYVGDLISTTEAAEREKRYALDENAGCYMYYFKHKNQQYCIDATVDTGKLGRLVNHSRNGNLMTKVVVVKQRPHLVLIAKDDVEAGEELCYDYGDRSKESLLHHPWLAF